MATSFKKGDRIFHEKYGAGEVLEVDLDDDCISVIFDFTDPDSKDSKIRRIKSKNLCLLNEAIKVGDRVHNINYGFGTIKEIQEDEHKKIRCFVDFDEWLYLQSCTAKPRTENGIIVLKEFRNKKIYEPRLSLNVLLEELGDEEKINPEHLKELRDIILETVKKWRKEYGYYKEIHY